MSYPITRLRRLRKNKQLRNLINETEIDINKLVYPLFITESDNTKTEINPMPGCFQLSINHALAELEECVSLGLSHFILFGIPKEKDDIGSSGYGEDSIIPTAIRAIKKQFPNICIWADVCLCEYTSHGHCGVLENETVNNDKTLPLLAKAAITYATSGADIIAPSDMMDGRVDAIRCALDAHGFTDIPIVSYAAKFASAFYGPFRDAAQSTPQCGDRTAYQMNPANSNEALREVELDIDEGADMVMVKPALSYLDIIQRVKEQYNIPIVAYNVSGEYSMVKAAAQNGWIDEQRVASEMVLSMFRAGADCVITYFAKQLATLKKG